MMSKLVALSLVVLALACVSLAAPAVYSTEISCLGWLCESVKVDLVTLDDTTGSASLVANIIPKANYYSIWSSKRLFAQSVDLSVYYYAIVDYKTSAATLYAINTVTMQVTTKKLPTTVMRQTLSSITGGPSGQLFAAYKNVLAIVDTSSGTVTKQFNLWTTASTYNNTGITTFVPQTNMLYIDTVNADCEILFAANVKTGVVTQSPCNVLGSPFTWELVYFAPYNNEFISLSTALMGNNLGHFYANATFGSNFLDFQDFAGINLAPSDWPYQNLYEPRTGIFYTVASDFSNGENSYLVSLTIPAGNVANQPVVNGNFEGFQRIRAN